MKKRYDMISATIDSETANELKELDKVMQEMGLNLNVAMMVRNGFKKELSLMTTRFVKKPVQSSDVWT